MQNKKRILYKLKISVANFVQIRNLKKILIFGNTVNSSSLNALMGVLFLGRPNIITIIVTTTGTHHLSSCGLHPIPLALRPLLTTEASFNRLQTTWRPQLLSPSRHLHVISNIWDYPWLLLSIKARTQFLNLVLAVRLLVRGRQDLCLFLWS